MKYVVLFFSLQLFVPTKMHSQIGKLTHHSATSIYKNTFVKYVGTINKNLEITMFLNICDSLIYGQYYYNKVGMPIFLNGVRQPDESFELREYDLQAGKVNYFRCKFDDTYGGISGEWFDEVKNKKLSVELKKEALGGIQVNKNVIEKRMGREENDTTNYFIMGGEHSISVTLDTILGLSKDAGLKINSAIDNQIQSFFYYYYDSTGLERGYSISEQGQQRKLQSGFKNMMNSMLSFGQLDYTLRTFSIESNIISFTLNSDVYDGGAHPNYGSYLSNYNILNGEKVSLGSIIEKRNQEKLFRIADSIYNANTGKENYSPLEMWSMMLSASEYGDNFVITRGGLLFMYAQGDITPYAIGPIEIFIPYKRILDILKPNSLVMELVK